MNEAYTWVVANADVLGLFGSVGALVTIMITNGRLLIQRMGGGGGSDYNESHFNQQNTTFLGNCRSAARFPMENRVRSTGRPLFFVLK